MKTCLVVARERSSAMTSGAVASGLPLMSTLPNTAACEKGSWTAVKSPRSIIMR
jgi:hypothetical protein